MDERLYKIKNIMDRDITVCAGGKWVTLAPGEEVTTDSSSVGIDPDRPERLRSRATIRSLDGRIDCEVENLKDTLDQGHLTQSGGE